MSIILSGLIHVFRPLLASLSGALDCKGLGPWYFLLGLRIVAIFFANGPWDTIREDVECNFIQPIEDRSRDFCRALCNNLHFPISVSATWGLVFIVLLLLTGLMRLTSPKKKKKREREEERDHRHRNDGLAIVATAPHGSSADISTIYMVGDQGLPRRYRHHHPRHPHHLYYDHWTGWHGRPMTSTVGEGGTSVAFGPCEDGGYGMPAYSGYSGQPNMPDCGYDMAPNVCYTDSRQAKLPTHCSGTDQHEMSTFQSHAGQSNIAPHCGETEQYMPTKCAPVPINSSPYKSRMPSQCWLGGEEHGVDESSNLNSTACVYTVDTPTRYVGQSKVPPQYLESGKYSMATKGRPVTVSNTGNIGDQPWQTWPCNKADMAIKRRPVPGCKMQTFQSHARQSHIAPHCGETEQYMPTKCAPVPINSSPYKSRMPSQCWLGGEEHGVDESSNLNSTACVYTVDTPTRYGGQSIVPPQCLESGKYSMATKGRPVTVHNTGNIGDQPWQTWPCNKADMAIKRRPVPGSKMQTKRHVTFDTTSRSEMCLGRNTCNEPWLAKDSNMESDCGPMGGKRIKMGPSMPPEVPLCCDGNPACTCADSNPCHMNTHNGPCEYEPNCCEPTCNEEATHRSHCHHNRHHRESIPGPQEYAKMSITKICGVPLFDVWVGLLLATEIGFMCFIIIFQIPRLIGETWICDPGITGCPQSVECTLRGRAEKRVVLWSLVFTAILFIIACSGYFHLRMCWNRKCRQMCGAEEEERREEDCADDTKPEEREFTEDVACAREEENRERE
ncbi:uncharacterized protein LOC128328934 [Hemicordylus capensis]|uniref:uncharacterized protein LOC128328934 n=1 Tax=Hemicordylus capensis TaxID=884348 RepID=UPI0023049653|nr:uncharacterized protein LOC128328934 [Hemicordylus capensis]